MVTSEEHIRELAQAPSNVLSLHAVATEVIMALSLDSDSNTHADFHRCFNRNTPCTAFNGKTKEASKELVS
jgi:hypothetical protein